MDDPVTRLRARLRLMLHAEDGVTLAEMVAGMALMGIFLSLFAGAVALMSQGSSRAATLTETSSQLNNAFIRLDRSIRYAAAISNPTALANAANNYYAEWETTNTGQAVCTQVQLNTGTGALRQRTWVVADDGSIGSLTAFNTLATDIHVSSSPFVLAASGPLGYEQLTVTLSSSIGSSTMVSASSLTFTSVNSKDASARAGTDPTQPNTVCQEAGRP
jgi:Na+-transporting methylmalonyl-CoA/oxaloacetate decarboxylase gamma subunit